MDKKEKKEKVIEVLNRARDMELMAIGQYMNQHYNLDDRDYGELAAQVKLIAVDEMRHAEMFAERIKELGGEPVASYTDKVQPGQDVEQVFTFDTKLEDDTVDAYNGFQQVCRDAGDGISAQLLQQVTDEEQSHLNYFDSVRDHIETLGQAYLAQKAGTPSDTGLNTQGFVARQSGD